ncbi:unnamed protein product [Owenia fusiformis]|uniref:Uncharacterized protein n=1 Tax=Owenia fusiformis TaxID=6347 RepID=A0A8S4PJN8_OWEFU|nr:unnamed protein product [Owenia fusiformis]
MTLHLKLLSFGETVLPAMDITSLNESDLNDPTKDWYLDFRKYAKVKQGISFDGLMPRANKTPYFTFSTYPEDIQFRLTNTKAAFMKQFKTIETDATMKKFLFVFKGDFTTLFGDESIEMELKKCFKEKSKQRKMVLKLIKKELNEDFVKHSCIKKIYDAKYKKEIIEKDSFHVKKELYRLPSVVINNLLHLLKSNTTCVWEITKLSGVNKENTHHLKMTLSTAAELRLRCYAQNNGQVDEDKGHFLPDILVGKGIDKKIFSKQLILRYFLTAIPLVNVMEEARPEEDDVLMSLGDVSGDVDGETLRADDVEEEGKDVLRSLKYANLYEASDLNKAMANILMNDTSAAKECMKRANELSSKINSSPTQMIMYILCNTYIKDDVISKPFFDSLKHQALETDGLDIGVKNTLGNALIQKGDVEEATEVLEKTVDESKDKRKITSLALLKVAYEKGGNEGKLQEIRDEHPEIDVIQSLMNKISDSKENEELVEKMARESQQLKKDLFEAQGVITALRRESEEAERKIEEQADKIMEMKRSADEVSPAHLDAITSYIRSLSMQYTEQE